MRHSLKSRAARLALAGVLVAGWSVAAMSVATSSHASVIAEDSAPADEPPADAPADAPASEPSAPSDDAQTADTNSDSTGGDAATDSPDSTDSESPGNSSDNAVDDPADEETDDPADDPADEETDDPADEETDDPADEETDDPADDGSDVATDEELIDADPLDSEEPDTMELTEESAAISLSINASVGAQAAGTAIDVDASGLLPNSRAELLIFSSPRVLATSTADDAGDLSLSATMPNDLEPGTHTVVLAAFDANENPVEQASEIVIAADGTISSITEGVTTEGLDIPAFSADPNVPDYPIVTPLDDPASVATKAVTAMTLVTVAGVGLGAAVGRASGAAGTPTSGGSSGPTGGGLDTAVRSRVDEIADMHPTSLPSGARIGIALASFGGLAPRFSPLTGRIVTDAAPLRALIGSLSFALPIISLILGIWAAVSVGGLAEPAAAAFLLPLMVIGVVDALSGVIGGVTFAVVVGLSGGIVNAGSVRTVIGVALVIAGPGLIASSFRDIRRHQASGSAQAWERLTDLVVVPLIGAWTTIAIVSSLPALGGLDFPIAEQARLFGLVALLALIAKVLLEEAAAKFAPAKMRLFTPEASAAPGAMQQVISALLRTGVFLFIAAAFVGNVWQLWVAAALFLLPGVLGIVGGAFKNSPGLWQALPEGVPLFAVMLVIGLIVTSIVQSMRGDSPDFAQMSFMWMAVPGFLLALLALVGREPRADDVRWYMRPTMVMTYRVGGVVVLAITVALALRG